MTKCEDVQTCGIHESISKGLAKVATRGNILLGLVCLLVAVATLGVTMAMDAGEEVDALRSKCAVHEASQGQRMKNIEEGVARNAKALERIEEILRKK